MSSAQRKRPSAAGKHRGHISTANHYAGRFQEEVLNAGVFLSVEDSSGCASLPTTSIPLQFHSLDEYVGTFDPLVLEEAREEVRSGYLENVQQAGLCERGIVSKVEEVGLNARDGTGPASTTSRPSRPWNARLASGSGRAGRPGRPHVRLTVTTGTGNNGNLARLDLKNNVVVLEFVPLGSRSDQDGNVPATRVPCLCVSSSAQSGLVLKAFKTCSKHRNAEEPPCSAWLSNLKANIGTTTVLVTKATQMTSSEREFEALHAVKNIDSSLIRYILSPSLLGAMKEVYETERRRELWPREASQEAFVKFLKSRYDHKQLEAIEMTACQLSVQSPDSTHSALSTKLPFVLIQGPPGTGKTHTVCGVLNVWHLTAYQQHYNSLIRSVKEMSAASGSGLDSVDAARRLGLWSSPSRKPRRVVCTPSNAACDELMARVMKEGFRDGQGNMYRPNVVRIGGDAAVDDRVRDRFLGTLVKAYTSMTEKEWHNMHQAKQTLLSQMKLEVRTLEASMGKVTEVEMHKVAQMLIRVSQDMEKVERQVEKLTAAWPSIVGSASAGGGGSGKTTEERQSVEELKTLLLSEAEMVFSTLSSTQQKIFKESAIRAPFHTVLIDEAGQASEVATLQPMTAGAKSIVLVGDPQQLPATIKSEAAKAVEMERSLFERLQANGCPVALLSVQYRMHPEIRKFPSKHFYHDLLEDAPAVTSLPPEPYHAVPLLGPYQVFDVASGKEERSKSNSVSNSEEARFAACLFMKLRRQSATGSESAPAPSAQPMTVAVITPYRQQRTLLRQTFKELCGADALNNVAIETIDSYQGRQVDVVILSCVRAGSGGGLGFVNDIRRMNVSITRARRSLWILGALGTLKRNKEWEALIVDAEARGVVVAPPELRRLLRDELAAAAEAERKRESKKAAPISVGIVSPTVVRAMEKIGVAKKAPKAMNAGKNAAKRDAEKPGASAELAASTMPMKKNEYEAKDRSGSRKNSARPTSGLRPMEKIRGRPGPGETFEEATPKPMTKDPSADLKDANRFAGTIKGRQSLENMMHILQRQANGMHRTGAAGGNEVNGPKEAMSEDAPHPFDPKKPKATKGKSARRRKRKAEDRGRDPDQADVIDSADSFVVSRRFPQLPDSR